MRKFLPHIGWWAITAGSAAIQFKGTKIRVTGSLSGPIITNNDHQEMEMTTQKVLSAIGILFGMQSIGLFVGAEQITNDAFAVWVPGVVGVKIGTMLHQAMGVMCLMVAIILYAARDLKPADGAKILMAAAFGLLITIGHGFYNMFTTEVKPPLPLLLLMTALTVAAVVTVAKEKGSAAASA